MSIAIKRSLLLTEPTRTHLPSNGARRANAANGESISRENTGPRKAFRQRVFVAAQNRLLREALSRTLIKAGGLEVVGTEGAEPFQVEDLLREKVDILLLSSRGSRDEDLAAIRKVRSAAPQVLILLIDVAGDETDFLQCIRAGVRGYVPREASSDDVLEALKAVQAGKGVCPGTLCAALFRYFEREATSFPSASLRQRLGLTRREQQLVPLIAEGLTNKEIANRFCLSEQTVKNHLYRMKHKVGAEDRLGIVHVCRTQGFMI